MKKKKRKAPITDLSRAASCTECTGILPAQVQTDREGADVAALQDIFPIPGTEDEKKKYNVSEKPIRKTPID